MGESVYGPTVRDVLLEASLRLGGDESFNLGDGSPHLQWALLARVTILPSQLTASPMFRLGASCSHTR
jgi:hypothetical protein